MGKRSNKPHSKYRKPLKKSKKHKKERRKKLAIYFKPLQTISPSSLRAVDGDTIKFTMHNFTFPVRLLGINAPELNGNQKKPAQPFSLEAKERLDQLLRKATDYQITLHRDHIDATENRLLGHLHIELDGKYENVCHILLSEGLAVPYLVDRGLTDEERDDYLDLADQARRRHIGVYSLPYYVTEEGRFNENRITG
ncbi:thermonuclease family protein [Risungbinella massiliensis]|uniref:thermonuclease family protein n=1 Tax=Risungbinella massiliensis TaxID=1329796 RepID=UPI0005CC3E95|nr:thermonuclease family protein [Risungbinella massiliensis]